MRIGKQIWCGLVLIGLAMAVGSCQDPAAHSSEDKNRRVFEVKGVVKEVMADQKEVRIAHEEIPDYMAAMTMTFEVKDAKELEGLEPGDQVEFRMIVTPLEGWIDQVKKVGHVVLVDPVIPSATVPSRFRLVRDVDPLAEGDLMPHYNFTNELGQPVALSDYKGKAVAFTFVFTRCPFPNFCPRMATNFASVYQLLKNQPAAPTNWHLFSITMDPQFDTPVVLKSYGHAYGQDPNRWNFLTGALIDITAIGEQVGLHFTWNPEEPGTLDHNLRTVVIDAVGRIQKIIIGNKWKPEELVAEITRAARAGVGEE
jgi:protein SCO1/2